MYYKRPHISRHLRNDAILSEKLPTLASPSWFVASYAVNPRETSFAQKLQLIGHIFVPGS